MRVVCMTLVYDCDTVINPFTACMTVTYMYVIKSLLLFACMTNMYVMHVLEVVSVVLDPIYDI